MTKFGADSAAPGSLESLGSVVRESDSLSSRFICNLRRPDVCGAGFQPGQPDPGEFGSEGVCLEGDALGKGVFRVRAAITQKGRHSDDIMRFAAFILRRGVGEQSLRRDESADEVERAVHPVVAGRA